MFFVCMDIWQRMAVRISGLVPPVTVLKVNSCTSARISIGKTFDLRQGMVLVTKYPKRSAIQQAFKSDVRAQNREETTELVKMFEGRIFHIVFKAAHDLELS
jgi:hypothetical protein